MTRVQEQQPLDTPSEAPGASSEQAQQVACPVLGCNLKFFFFIFKGILFLYLEDTSGVNLFQTIFRCIKNIRSFSSQ